MESLRVSFQELAGRGKRQRLSASHLSLTLPSFIQQKQKDYSYAFGKLYNNFNNKSIHKTIAKKFNLDSWEFQSLKVEVETKIKQNQTFRIKMNNRLLETEKEINELKNNENKSNKKKRKLYKLFSNSSRIKKSLFKNITFGGKSLLKKINENLNDKEKYKELKEQYSKNRALPIFICGEAPQTGNRKFNFNFKENKIVYKCRAKNKIDIEFICSNKQKNYLLKVQELCRAKKIPVTVKLSTEFVYITFDESCLNGYKLDPTLFIKDNKEHNKQVYKDLEELKLIGKKENRYMAVDLNPQFIGVSICEKFEDKFKVIKTACYNLSNLSCKLKLSSKDKKQIYQNNKRRFEISQTWKSIFNLATNYKVAHFILEELEFKETTINENSKESNRKCKNIWHREITKNLINKYCNILGINKIEVNPCYSSFIGNIQNKYFDPISASIEICRRGIFKFTEGKFYPELKRSDFDTMSNLIKNQMRDVKGFRIKLLEKLFECKTWRTLFDFFKQTRLKYRRSLESMNFKEFSLNKWLADKLCLSPLSANSWKETFRDSINNISMNKTTKYK